MKLPINDIKIGDRQRRETGDLAPLMDSIKRYGLINPIVVYDIDHELQSGFRRLSACKALGMTEVEVRLYSQQLSAFDQQVVELDENPAGVVPAGFEVLIAPYKREHYRLRSFMYSR